MASSLKNAAPDFKKDLEQAYKDAMNEGTKDSELQGDVIDILATGLTEAINTFTTNALVSTAIEADPGQMDTPAAGATVPQPAGTGDGGGSANKKGVLI